MTALEAVVAQMTLAELARLAGSSVEDIVTAALGGRALADATAHAQTAPRTQAESRHQAPAVPGKLGRGELSVHKVAAVLASAGKPVSSNDIRTQVDGTMPQVRAALHKLAEAGRVKITGERRGTRYSAS